MPDYIAVWYRWLLGQLREMVRVYGDFADRADEAGMGEDADAFRRTRERVQNLLDKKDLRGIPARATTMDGHTCICPDCGQPHEHAGDIALARVAELEGQREEEV